MFGNLKDLYQLQSKAKEIQKKLASESITAENKGIIVTMNGNQEVLSVTINPDLSQEDQEKYLKETFNDALKKIQQLMAGQLMSSMH